MMLKLFLLAATIAATGSAAGAWTSQGGSDAPATATATATATTAASDAFATRPPAAWDAQDPADALYRTGREQLNRREYRAAARTFAQIADRFPNSSYAGDALYWEAYAHYSLNTSTGMREALRALESQRTRYPRAATRGDADALAVRVRGALARSGDGNAAESVAGIATQESKPCTNPRSREDDEERVAALNALLQMNAERALPIIKTVLAKRDACSESLREKAVFLVSQLQSGETEELLLDVVRNDPSRDVRRKAVFWLGQVNSERAAAALEQLLKSSTDQQLREEAVHALMQQDSPRGHAAVRAVAEDASAPEGLREKAVFWIGQHGSPENARYLRGLFDRLGSASGRSADGVREKILFSLSQMEGEGNDRWLMDVAADPKFSVGIRKQAIFSAGQARVSTAELVALYPKLDDRELKGQLIWVLSEQKDAQAVDRLMAIARSDPDREMRKKAIFWLGQMNDPRVKQFLIDIING